MLAFLLYVWSLGVLATWRLNIFNLQRHIREFKSRGFRNTLIKLIPYQYQNTIEINPDNEYYQTSDRTIEKVICRDVGDIEIKQYRSNDK